FAEELHELADLAYFDRTILVASAHNLPVDSYPWRFSSVISVGSHEERDPLVWYANPDPPVELFARGVDVEVAWPGGATLRCTGNSFAAPHIAGVAAHVLAKHPELTPYQLKSVLHLTATNAGGEGGATGGTGGARPRRGCWAGTRRRTASCSRRSWTSRGRSSPPRRHRSSCSTRRRTSPPSKAAPG